MGKRILEDVEKGG